MTSQELASLLIQQSTPAPHQIRLNDQTLGTTGLNALITSNLGRKDGTLILTVDPTTIPQNPPTSGFTLSARVPAGPDGFLSLDDRDASIEFLVGSTINLVLTVSTRESDGNPVSWVFSDSFPELSYLPYDQLTLTGPQMIFSTGASGTPAAGLDFDGTLTLDGFFAMIATLIGASTGYSLKGAFVQNSDGLTFDLQAGLNVPPMTLGGVVTLNNLVAGTSFTVVQSKEETSKLVQLYLGATVTFSNSSGTELPLMIRAAMPLGSTSGQVLVLSILPFAGTPVDIAGAPSGAARSGGVTTVTTTDPHGLSKGDYVTVAFVGDDSFDGTYSVLSAPTPTTFTYAQTNLPNTTSGGGTASYGINTSLEQLGSLIGGQSWDNFFSGPAAGLKSYFETFGLLGYSTSFVLSTGNISSISLSVGTLQPWPLWSNYTLTLSGTWNMVFMGSRTVSTLELKADFSFGTINFEVDVELPNLLISGRQSGGAVTYSLDDLNQELFDGALDIPPDLLTVSVSNFSITIDVNAKQFSIGATANASVALFGVQLLGIHNMGIGVTVDASGPQNIYTASLNGEVSVGSIALQTSATLTNDPTKDCVFSMHLVNETVGSMLNHLIHLVDPTYNASFGEPWNKLLDISLDALVLKVTLPGSKSKSPRSVTLEYDIDLDLGFIKLASIGLVYIKNKTGPGSVTIALEGSFLGQQFGKGNGTSPQESQNPPLSWDAINGAPPAVPGQGDSLFDLQYVGLGQHIAFEGVDLPNMTAVMKALRESVIPIQAGQLPPFGQNSLAFSAESNWLVGADFSVMSTVAISVIFNDPNLYGVLIGLYGEKASIFKGLTFEILYRKISDTIGVYHIELKLPDAMRYLQFGEVSITLPVVVIDIYTNGNFRVDFGFPANNNFANSFALQIFPFVGFGGFYFALLDGATSTRVPQITNGTFSPVIEFGVGLSVGVGKTINMSVFSGGLTVTVEGILQGVLAWFNPYLPASSATYYWLQGTVAIVGTLYATIDLSIIKANINLTAYASVTLTMEAYKPVYINFSVGVSIRISVKVVFFTIHLSFKMTISASFTLGSTSQPPWQIAQSSGGSSAKKSSTSLLAQPQLRGQQTLHSPTSLHAGYRRALRLAALPQSAPITTWPAVCVLPQGLQTVGLWALPAFTKSETAAGETDAVMLLAAGNSINPGAATHNDHETLAGPAPASATFNLLMQAMLGWGIYVETGGGDSVTADQLTDLQQQLKTPETIAAAFDYATLIAFLAKNFVFDISTQTEWLIAATNGAVRSGGTSTITTTTNHGFAAGNTVTIAGVTDSTFDGQYVVATVPSATTFTYDQQGQPDSTSANGTADVTLGVALFPMIPAIELTDTAGTTVTFSSFNPVDATYQAKADAYFQLLQVQHQQRSNGGSPAPQAKAEAEPTTSVSTIVFSQYFNMLMLAGVQAAIDLLANYPYTTAAAMSIADVAAAVGDSSLDSEPLRVVTPNQDQAVLNTGAHLALPDVVHQIQSGETFDSVATTFQNQGALNESGQKYSTNDLLAANLKTAGIFNPGTDVQYSNITYSTQAGDSLNLIAARLLLRATPTAQSQITNQEALATQIQTANPNATFEDDGTLTPGQTLTMPTGNPTYTTVVGDSFMLIAAYELAQQQGLVTYPDLVNSLLAEAGTVAATLTTGADLATPNRPYTVHDNYSLQQIAGDWQCAVGGIALANQDAANVLQPGVTLTAGGKSYQVVAGDTFASVVAAFGTLGVTLTVPQLAVANQTMPGIFVNQATLAVNDLTVPQGATLTSLAGQYASYGFTAAGLGQSNAALPDLFAAQTQLAIPPITSAIQAGNTIASLATALLTTVDIVEKGLLAAQNLLAPQGVLKVPLVYAVAAGDTFSGIAAKFDLTLQDVADQAVATKQNGEMTKIFAADQTITISDLTSINVQTLMADLLNEAEWNNASGMVSRFMLSGLRLPDPNNAYFQGLTVQDMFDPAKLGGVVTKPIYQLTGQQYAITNPPAAGYQITLANAAGVPWLTFGASSSASFGLTGDQLSYLNAIATTALSPQIASLTRLSLFQMVPPRIALQNHIAWQAAAAPAGCLSSQSATGTPSIWLFPDSLVELVAALKAPSLSEIVVAKHTSADQPVDAEQADCYAWATIVDITVSLPTTDGPSASVANAYVINGADDTGAELLQQVYSYLAGGEDTATLYLLYSPDPTSANPSGLSSDQLNADATYILKTNLSTLTHSGGNTLMKLAASDPTEVIAASLSDPADFVALLWEASVTRSGGFYLNYVNQNGGAALPASVFGTSTSATLSLLVLLKSQANNRDAAIQPFNNCAVVGGNIDTTTSSLFVQPATYVVQENDSLTAATTNFNQAWGTSYSVLQVATFNQSVPLLLLVGAEMTIPGQGQPYVIEYGDTLAGIVAKFKLANLQTLITAGQNETAAILATGASMQFADNVLRPATTVPPGTVGFEMTRTNPDPSNLTYDQMTPSQIVSSLFNLAGFSIAAAGDFLQSGAGLPTTPADSLQDQTDGLEERNVDDSTDPNWYYQQTVAVYPFAKTQYGSASAALPPVATNPYNGVGYDQNAKQVNQATLSLDLQDIYGNIQPLPPQFSTLQVPVGYYDNIVSLGSWPSLALSYLITGAQPHPTLALSMTMQQARYIPSAALAVSAAVSAVNADLISYRSLYYQLAQPDLGFALQTTLDANSMASLQAAYPLSKTPFFSFAYGAYVYLAALATMQPVQVTSDGTANVQALTDQYGVTPSQLFTANQDTLYSTLFGAAQLVVPAIYATAESDSLALIVQKWPNYNLTVNSLAEMNQNVALGPGADLTAPARTATVTQVSAPVAASGASRSKGTATITTTEPHGLSAGDFVILAGVTDSSFDGQFTVASVPGATSFTFLQEGQPDASSGNGTASQLTPSLNAIAQGAQASITALAEANQAATNILQAGVTLTVGTNTYRLAANDSFANAAQQLDSTVDAVATANQWLQGLFVAGATLTVNDVLVRQGDTLATLAHTFTGGDVGTLATDNAYLPNLFAPSTQIQLGTNANPKLPAETDSLASFAVNNNVTVPQLAAVNCGSGTVFAAGAPVNIPGVMTNPSAQQYCTYTAGAQDTLGGLAQKFNAQPADIAALNPDLPGLLAAGQTVTDATSGKSVQTAAGDTFDSIIARFQQQQSVTVTLAQLATDVASQNNLLTPGGLWICPPMLGGASGLNADNSLSGLASAYNVTAGGAADVVTLATANAAAIGLLASGVTLTLSGVTITTNGYETFNSLVNRLAENGVSATVADVANGVATVASLINPQARVVPVPPPSPQGNQVAINPNFSASVFQILVNIITTRNPQWVDPDFTNVPAVSRSVYGVAPEPDPQNNGSDSPFSLTQFATDLQNALPGLQIATGGPVAEGDSESASTIWAVNFGSGFGPQITYQFAGANTQYFALPPLSTSLMGGTVNIIPYVSGQTPPFSGTPQTQTFQAIDLDVWLSTFLQAVDLFLSPAYAVPAYALDPTDTINIVEQKQVLAEALAARLDYVLQGNQPGSLGDAQGAIYQAMLTELSSAFTVDTIVQVPVTVSSPFTEAVSAPRLSGKIIMNDPAGGDSSPQSLPNTFSFSTAKVALTQPGATGTFLFSVKSPASHKEANLDLQYVVTELELPDPNSVIGDYEGSTWLKFILPLDNTNSAIGEVTIPVPLRSYPSPVTLASQTAQQSVAEPQNAADLLGWDFGFAYQHTDAEQDTPLIAMTFNAAADPATAFGATSSATLHNIFAALAQFMSAYPLLKDDLALLPTITPGSSNATMVTAIQAFNQLVNGVADAWKSAKMAAVYVPPVEVYYYQMQKQQSEGASPTLTTLTISSVNPDTGQLRPNPSVLWPAVVAQYDGNWYQLALTGQNNTQATYEYPAGIIPADAEIAQNFLFGGRAIASNGAARSGGTTTITTVSDHGFGVGEMINVTGVGDGSFNGYFTVATAPSSTSFTYQQTGQPDASSGNGTAGKIVATAASTYVAPQLFSFNEANILSQQNGRAGVAITRNLSLVAGVATNPAFVYQTPLVNFTSPAVPSVFAGNDIGIGSGDATGIAAALGAFLQTLLTSENQWQAGDRLSIRLSAAYSYALATTAVGAGAPSELSPRVPILLVPSFDFDPTSDWNAGNANSFVSQVQAAVIYWQRNNQPVTKGGSFVFDLTIYAAQGQMQQLVRATSLQYLLS